MEGCCLFVMYQWGNPQAPIYRGNAEGAKLPHGYVAEKTSPEASELKKSPSSLDQKALCKGLAIGSFFILSFCSKESKFHLGKLLQHILCKTFTCYKKLKIVDFFLYLGHIFSNGCVAPR
ncbi:MAG: hypothetical protein R6T98_12720 [Desulfatiglandales bacterium]